MFQGPLVHFTRGEKAKICALGVLIPIVILLFLDLSVNRVRNTHMHTHMLIDTNVPIYSQSVSMLKTMSSTNSNPTL